MTPVGPKFIQQKIQEFFSQIQKNTGKLWKKNKEGSKISTIVGRTARNTIGWNMFRIQQTWLLASERGMSISVLGMVSVCKPQIHQFEDKSGFTDSKNPVSILSWNQGNHIMSHLWIQTDHNLHHKCPDDGPCAIINMYHQIMISLESCCIYYGRVWSACFCMEGQPRISYTSRTELLTLKFNCRVSVWRCALTPRNWCKRYLWFGMQIQSWLETCKDVAISMDCKMNYSQKDGWLPKSARV